MGLESVFWYPRSCIAEDLSGLVSERFCKVFKAST